MKLFIILTGASELVKKSCLSIPRDKPLPEKTEEQWIYEFHFDSQIKVVGNWFLCENTELSQDQISRITSLLNSKTITTDTQGQDPTIQTIFYFLKKIKKFLLKCFGFQ